MLQDTLAKTNTWFEKAVAQPTSKNLNTQIGCHFEEVNEMTMCLTGKDFETQILIDTAKMALNALANHLKTHDDVVEILPKDREEYLDALCDQIVTSVGCAHMSDLDILGGLAEVNRSNFSKFDDDDEPIFNADMKIIKSAYYEKPDLSPFV